MQTKKRHELDSERLATTNESGQRVYLYPEDASGPWKTKRHILYWLLLIVFLILPWVRINGKPALMLNIFTREFTFFGLSLSGIEPIFFFLLVASVLFFIAFITSIFGRVWCGWACPQTVFIQTVFAQIEKWAEGSARQRKAMDEGPVTINKFFRKSLKWVLYSLLSFLLAVSFMAYFTGARELISMLSLMPEANVGILIAIMIFTVIFLVDFGWFREQFCIIACPYGRMQSVLMDSDSLIIAYDVKRGEPRRGLVDKAQEGDCINCYACVKVCPTGIDIRRGTQLECIACTQCIDACDEIMTKIDKPQGLIKYSTENKLAGIVSPALKTRSIAYILISTMLLSGMFLFLNQSTQLSFVFMRGKGEPYEILSGSGDKNIINHFTLKISHQGNDNYRLYFEVAEPDNKKKIDIVTPSIPLLVTKQHVKTAMFFSFNSGILKNGTKKFKMNVLDDQKNVVATQEVVLVGPN